MPFRSGLNFLGIDPTPPPLIQYWHSDVMPDRIASLIGSFTRLNPDLPHLVFSERSAAAFIGEHFDARQLRAFRSCAVPAMQSDYLRCCAALALGGVYCDAYWQCIARMQPLIPPPGSGRLFQADKGNIINGIFAFGAPGHAFLELALEIATVNIECRLFDSVYFTTGPMIFGTIYWLHKCGSFDAFFEFASRRGVAQKYVRAYCEVIGDYARVSGAVEGIEVCDLKKRHDFIGSPEPRLPKNTYVHWSSIEKIYRDPVS